MRVCALRQRAEVHFPRRQRREPRVAEHADVDLAAVDVFLDERIALDLLVDELHALAQALHVLDERGLRDAERRVLGRRLHEQRKGEAARVAKAAAEREQPERRRRDAVRGEHAFRQHLVARQHHAARIAARVALPYELEVSDDVVVVGDDARELVEQVEHHVRAPLVDRLAKLGQMIADADDAHFVARAAQRMQNVVLGAKLVDLRLAQAADVVRRHERLVHHQKDSILPHRK